MKSKVAIVVAMLLLVVAVPEFCRAQTQMLDVVYLKDGSIIRGIIIEQVPGVSVKIQTADKNIFVYQMTQIEKLGRVPAPYQGGKKSPGVSFLLSFLIPGAGQYYNGQIGKGIAQDVLFLGGIVVAERESYEGGLIMVSAACLWSMIDAPLSASAINRRIESSQFGHQMEWNYGSRVVGLDLHMLRGGAAAHIAMHF